MQALQGSFRALQTHHVVSQSGYQSAGATSGIIASLSLKAIPTLVASIPPRASLNPNIGWTNQMVLCALDFKTLED